MPLISKTMLKRAASGALKSGIASGQILSQIRSKSFLTEQHFDIFLSHCFKDADDVLMLYELLTMAGYKVFVDWIADPNSDRSDVTKDTADGLRMVMMRSDSLLYAVSSNSWDSTWMTWELGYSDALHGKVAVVPVTDVETASEVYTAEQEYLSLYPYVTVNRNLRGGGAFWVSEAIDKFVSLDDWLKGEKPRQKTLFTTAMRERGVIDNPKDRNTGG
jgi:hypothetical protein